MNYREKTAQLREEINRQLLPLIDADYAYLELPYYENIGDTLIWDGTLRFLEQFPFKCLYTASSRTFVYRELPESAIILLQGGGNFGDLWAEPHQFRKKVIELYPRNRVIVLPQTVWYENPTDTEAFLGTQGYIWDTQTDMFMCLIGATVAVIIRLRTMRS